MFLVVIACLLAGIGVGYALRRLKLHFVHGFILTLIWLLLFLLGLEVGSNRTVVSQFARLGFDAFWLAAGATLGSVLAAWVLWLFVRNKSVEK